MRQSIEKSSRIFFRLETPDPGYVSHPVNDAWIVVTMVNDFSDVAALNERCNVLRRHSSVQKMIIENASLDTTSIYTDIKDILAYVQLLIRKMF